MAYKKLSPKTNFGGGVTHSYWRGRHGFTEFDVTSQYDAYVDPDNSSNKPYLCLRDYRIMSTAVDRTQISDRVPFTIKIKINGVGTEYSISSGTSIKEYATGEVDMETGWKVVYYYVEFSSSTHIVLPDGGTECTINTTITTKNGETYTFIEKACSPVSVKMNGQTSITTGAVNTYTLSTALAAAPQRLSSTSTDKFFLDSSIITSFPSQGEYQSQVFPGFADAYTQTSKFNGNISEIRVAPIYSLSSPGEVGTPRVDIFDNKFNYVCVYYYYYTDDESFGDNAGDRYLYPYNKILIAEIFLGVTITSREEIDQDMLPELEYAHDVDVYNTDARHPHILKYGAYICGQSEYRWRVQYKMRYGNAIYAVDIDDYTSGSLKHKRVEYPRNSSEYYSSYTYSVALGTVVSNAAVNYTVEDMWGNTFTYSDSVTVIPYSIPAMTTARLQRCSEVSSGSGEGYYTYDGKIYQVDDYGDYCLVEWAINITPLNNQNSRYLTISDPASNSRSITLSSYTASGFYVVPADGEKSYDCKFTLRDDFKTTIVGKSLSTVMAIMDFLKEITVKSSVAKIDFNSTIRIDSVEYRYRITRSGTNMEYSSTIPIMSEGDSLYAGLIITYTKIGSYGQPTETLTTTNQFIYAYNTRLKQPGDVSFHFKINGSQPGVDDDGWVDDITGYTASSYYTIIYFHARAHFSDMHGVAFGKVAELERTLDIHRDWTLRMPMNIEIGNYYGNGQSVMLSTWMKNTVDRMQAIVDSRPYAIYRNVQVSQYVTRGQFFEDYAAVCVPSYGALINLQSHSFQVACTGDNRAIMKINKPVKVNRQYLHFEFDSFSRSFASNIPTGDPQYYCKIYVLSTEPTTVNQYTGIPNGTVLTSLNVGALDWYGSMYDDGVQFWRIQDDTEWNKYLDVSRWMGQNVWIALSIASGVSAQGTYTENGYIWVRTIELTDDNGT